MGGMRPQTRVFRWLEIARITLEQFDGDLDRILREPYAKAKKALKLFPNIGDPGAAKILVMCGVGSELPLDWNGVRVLTRIGFGRQQKSYGATLKSIQEDLKDALPRDAASLAGAYALLRQHGKTLCRENGPQCGDCPAVGQCAWAGHGVERE
jgi:endonuclease III